MPPSEVEEAFSALVGAEEYSRLHRQWSKTNRNADALHGLSRDEMFAIWLYTTPRSFFSLINTPLHAQAEPPHVRLIADLIDKGLRKLPVYEGELYRGVNFPDPELFASLYPVGAEVTWHAFSSCSPRREDAYPYKILVQIYARRGRRVTYYSGGPEDEIILSLKTRIRVEESTYFADQDRAVIVVSELP